MAEIVTISQNNINYNNIDGDIILNTVGIIDNKDIEIKARSISATECNLSSCVTYMEAQGDLALQEFCTKGFLNKTIRGNCAFILNSNKDITIKNCTFGQSGYNCLEISKGSAFTCENVLIENCIFSGTLTNNAISIFKVHENSNITIKNCVFKQVSNALRFSNHLNVSGIEINFENCSIESWDDTPEYGGIIVFQDDICVSTKDAQNQNRFKFNKITVNFVDTTGPNGKIINPCCTSEIVGTSKQGQIAYVYNKYEKNIPYSDNKERFPIFTFVDTITGFTTECDCDCCIEEDNNDCCCTDKKEETNKDNVCSCCNCRNYCNKYCSCNQICKPSVSPPTTIPTVPAKQEIINGGWEEWNTVFEGIGKKYWNQKEGFVYENLAKEISKAFSGQDIDISDPLKAIEMLKKYGVMKYQKNYPLEILLDKMVKDRFITKKEN